MEGAKNLSEVTALLKGKAAGEPEPSSVACVSRSRAVTVLLLALCGSSEWAIEQLCLVSQRSVLALRCSSLRSTSSLA